MSLSDKIAKRRADGAMQSFEGHTIDALLILKDYLEKNELVLKKFSDNFRINYNLLINIMFIAIYLHDVGKLTKEFQRKIINGERGGAVSHAFFGLPFINSNLPENLDNMVKLLTLSHHTQLYNRIYEDAKLSHKVNYLREDIREWTNLSVEYKFKLFNTKFDSDYYPIYQERKYLNDIELNEAIIEEIFNIKQDQSKSADVQTKAIYSLCISVLKHCDHESSKLFEEAILKKGINGPILTNLDTIPDHINYAPNNVFTINSDNIIRSSDGKPIKRYTFQQELSKLNSSCIISAPCGRGKTEGAILCALNILKIQNKNKIIFALPTQITSNAMYKRLKAIFGADNVGLYHGMSRYHHYEENDIGEENLKSDEHIRSIVLSEKVFGKAVTITTIDHLIYSLVHGYKQADYALGNILNSVVIFDEIHYYEKHTLRYIIDCLRIFNSLNIPYIAMSGTLPNFIITELNKLQQHILIEDEEGLMFSPFIIKREGCPIFESINNIKDNYQNKKNQIVILNTIPRAKKMYKTLCEENISKDNLYLLHSQFTFNDRKDKEREIYNLKNKNPWILVSTQAIEISVDISCDIMHTEIAPIDALGQRGGRLNRGGQYHNNKYYMYIYPPENHMPYCSDTDEEDIIDMTNSALEDIPVTYKIIKEWCDKVYSDINLSPQNLELVFKKCTLFGYNPKEIRHSEEEGNLIEVREESYPTIDVIPQKYWDNIKSNIKDIDKYRVKIPKWWFAHFGKDAFYISEPIGIRKYIVCTIPYSEDYGFNIDKIGEESESSIIC
jgi:CRISPR-associated endonuclease/helicase Cas3